jgi:phosphoribosylglycinamide formyltransferase-1
VAQAAVPVLSDDTAETLALRVLEAEHRLYPHALALVASGAVSVQGELVVGTDQVERVVDTNDQAQVPLFSPPVP